MNLLIGLKVEYTGSYDDYSGKQGVVLDSFKYSDKDLMLVVLVDDEMQRWDTDYVKVMPGEIERINKKRKGIIEKVNRFEIMDIKED